MALVERLMHIDPTTNGPMMSVHLFFACGFLRVDGLMVKQDVVDLFGFSAADIAEYDLLAGLAPGGTTALATAQKAMYVERVHAIFIAAEHRVPGFATPAEVRAKLGL